MSETCHHDPDRGWLTPEHVRDCTDVACRGCKPCGKSHCAMRDRCGNHVEQHAGIYTCPSCIGKTRRAVIKIAERYAELPEEFDFAGVDSEVLNLHGPAASPEQIAARRRWDDTRGRCDYPRTIPEDDPHHPLAVLGRWDMAIRESYAQPTDLFVTVSRAADYLAGEVLNTFAHTQEFEDFTRDVGRCLTHLEDVLAISQRPELGAPCPACRESIQAEGKDERPPRLEKRYGQALDGSKDGWVCPANVEHWWNDTGYRARVADEYVDHAEELPARELAQRLSVPASTVRSWISPTRHVTRELGVTFSDPKLKPVGSIKGRKTYSVKAAEELLGRQVSA